MRLVELCKRHSTALAIAAYIAFILLAGLTPSGMQDVSPWAYCAFFLGTGVVEEGVFCGMVFQLLRRPDGQGGSAAQVTRAAIVTAILFGFAHLSFGLGVDLGLLKVVQAALFGLCMVLLFALTDNLSWSMMAHGFFDVAYFTPAYTETGALPPYPAAVSPDASLAVLAVTSLFFAIVAAIMFRRFFKSTQIGRRAG